MHSSFNQHAHSLLAPVIQSFAADVLVVGGGMAGVMAALAAKTSANRVLIIEPSNVLGGQGTVGGVAGFCGDTVRVNTEFADLVARLAEQGHIDPYRPNDDRRAYDLEWCAFFLQEMVVQRGIEVLLHARVVAAEAVEGRVRTVTVSSSGGLLTILPKFVIDASGNCSVCMLTGFPVEHKGSNRQLPMSLYFTLWDTGRKVTAVLPKGCPRWQNDEEIPMTSVHQFPSGKVEVKMKVVGFDAADGFSRSAAEIFARRQMHGLIYYLQTTGYRGRRFDTHALASVSRGIGVREERRIIGEHVLTEAEARRAVIFDDAVAVNTYHIDYHWPDRMERAGTGITDMLAPHHLPLRMMIPRGARNLLVPGRGASGDQTAMSAYRVMAVVAQMGFAAGQAAQQCVERGLDIKGIDVPALQRAIEHGGQSLNLSDYGNYLRSDLFTKESLPTAFAAGAIDALALALLRNGCFLAVWSADGQLNMAERRECVWRLLPTVSLASGQRVTALQILVEDGHAFAIHFTIAAGQSGQMVSSDGGQSWTMNADRAEMRNEVAIGAAAGFSLIRNKMGRAVELRIQSKIADGRVVLGEPVQGSGAAEAVALDEGILALAYADQSSGVMVVLSRDHGASWFAQRAVCENKTSHLSITATRTGIAVLMRSEEGALQFWHGSVERIIDGPPKAAAHALQA